MRRTMVALAAAAALGTGALAGCSALGRQVFQNPVVNLRDVRVTGVGLTGASLDVVLNVYNPNGYRLDLGRLTYALNVEDTRLAEGVFDGAMTFTEGDTTAVRIPITLSYSGIGSAARQLMNSGAVNYTVNGDVGVRTPIGNYTVPYRSTGRYSAFSGNQRQ